MTEVVLKHYVEFLFPGAFLSESSIEEVVSRDSSKVQVPKEAFSYRFFDRQEVVATDGEVLQGQPRNYSETHYFGEVKTREDILREHGPCSTLYRNMESNGWERVVKTRMGNYQPLEEEDVIIPA